jgi:hypothetical protein
MPELSSSAAGHEWSRKRMRMTASGSGTDAPGEFSGRDGQGPATMIWDPDALPSAWDAALQEYKVYDCDCSLSFVLRC